MGLFFLNELISDAPTAWAVSDSASSVSPAPPTGPRPPKTGSDFRRKPISRNVAPPETIPSKLQIRRSAEKAGKVLGLDSHHVDLLENTKTTEEEVKRSGREFVQQLKNGKDHPNFSQSKRSLKKAVRVHVNSKKALKAYENNLLSAPPNAH